MFKKLCRKKSSTTTKTFYKRELKLFFYNYLKIEIQHYNIGFKNYFFAFDALFLTNELNELNLFLVNF